ncbi:condensation domain-containing protein [Streptomyces sp. NBC_01429]|uniref:condensation domain-containing protein n=1 Tax=Streptomyces sp. NBC_01429 TaxID=2903862 RepID=UPI002E2D9833|nr:condensation domain-containing protein [Streptomyces sp. NBC_01429]
MSADLVARLAALTPEQRALIRQRIPQVPRKQPQLTPGQRRLWEAHRWVGDRPVDVVCQVVRLTGAPVGLDLLAERVLGFVQAHEALRTTFESDGEGTGDGVRPVVRPRLPPRVVRTRCAGADEAHALARELAAEPFDLANGPLLRVALAEGTAAGGGPAEDGADGAWLLVVVHNLVFDAWSFELLLDELARTADTGPVAAPPFSGFAHEQRRLLESAAGRAAAAYWKAEVAGAPPPLPTDRPRGSGTGRSGARVEFTLPRAVADGIAAAAQREAATAYTGWLAVAWAALAEYGGRDDVLLGTFTAGRDRPGTTDVVGYLLNVLPVRLRDAGDGSHAARTRAARTATRAGLAHAAHPGELIAEERRVPGTHPLLDAVFVFDNLGEGGREIQGARAVTEDLDKGTARYDLTLAVYPGPDGARGWLEYDTELYEAPTARRIAERFTALAEKAAEGGHG